MNKLAIAAILFGGASAASADSTTKPTLGFGTPTVTGTYDAKPLVALVKKSSSKLLDCYSSALAKEPELRGTVDATFTIGVDGKVTAAAAAGVNKGVASCIAAAISKLKFAKPKEGPVEVTFPLLYDSPKEVAASGGLTGTGNISSGSDDTNIQGGLIGGGTSLGPGVGGGGTGWGTISTKRHGTVGHGSGSAVGGPHGHSDAPIVSIGQGLSTGDLDKTIIRRYIKRNIQKLQYCYEQQLLTKKTLQGTVTAKFTISADGVVTSSTASGMKDKEVESCIATTIKAIAFPKPKGGGEVAVTYPLTFRPAETAAATK
jgi:hypothetical protein